MTLLQAASPARRVAMTTDDDTASDVLLDIAARPSDDGARAAALLSVVEAIIAPVVFGVVHSGPADHAAETVKRYDMIIAFYFHLVCRTTNG